MPDHFTQWQHHSEDPLGINWSFIRDALKNSKHAEKYIGRKITDEELKKLEEVAKVIAKFVDAWGPDNINHAQIWLERGSNMDDLEEFIKKYAKDPEKTFQYLEELRQVMHKYIKPKGLRPPTTGTPATKAATKPITEKEPSEVEETFKTLKNLGVDLKLETGNVAERKAKIYAWLVNKGLITVEQEGGKIKVKPTEKMHELLARHGNAAGAVLKWAAEEGVGLEHVKPVSKILAALEEVRQRAKSEDPALAKALEKALGSKHTIRELYYLLQGHYTPEELSERWSKNFGKIDLITLFERHPELAKATLEAMRKIEETGISTPPVPSYWLDLLRKVRSGHVRKEDVDRYLAMATYGKHVFTTLHSLAGAPLPERGKDIETLLKSLREPARIASEAVLQRMGVNEDRRRQGIEYMNRNIDQLAHIIAHLKDPRHIEEIERELEPIVNKLPEQGRKIGLFKREKSPREKVEVMAAMVVEFIEGRGELREILHYGENLRKELREYVGDEADRLLGAMIAPAVAAELRRRGESAEELLARVSYESLRRFTSIELKLKELRKGASNERIHDDLLRHLAFWDMPGIPAEPLEPAGRERVRKTLEGCEGCSTSKERPGK